MENRPARHEAINAALSQQTTTAVLSRLDAANIANAQLRNMREFSAHPQLAERNRWRDVESPVPALGEHTEKIRAELETAEP